MLFSVNTAQPPELVDVGMQCEGPVRCDEVKVAATAASYLLGVLGNQP